MFITIFDVVPAAFTWIGAGGTKTGLSEITVEQSGSINGGMRQASISGLAADLMKTAFP